MTTGPRWPSHHSESAGTCSRCARDPPPGLQRAGGLSDPRAGGPLLLPQTSPAPELLVSPPLQAIPSVSQAPVPSAGQVLVSVLLLPNCRPCGSGSGARHVKRKRCSWRAPPWVTFTGNQGVQGVLRRTSGQASGLHVLNSCRVGWFQSPVACKLPCTWLPGPAPQALTKPQPGQELPFSQVRRRDCTPPPQLLLHLLQEPQEAQKMGTGQGVFSLQNLGR